jgi:hypothetical protein
MALVFAPDDHVIDDTVLLSVERTSISILSVVTDFTSGDNCDFTHLEVWILRCKCAIQTDILVLKEQSDQLDVRDNMTRE